MGKSFAIFPMCDTYGVKLLLRLDISMEATKKPSYQT